MSKTLTEYWDDVEAAMPNTLLVAFDGCHKMYAAMDTHEADWFRAEYPHVVEGSADVMLSTLRDWWEQSCSLRFIYGVTYNAVDPNAGFVSLIPQDWCDDYEDDEDDDY